MKNIELDVIISFFAVPFLIALWYIMKLISHFYGSAFKRIMWRIILRKGWYQVTWTGGFFKVKGRSYWDGKDFRRYNEVLSPVGDYPVMSIFVKRIKEKTNG